MEGAGRFGAKRLRVRATGILVEEGRVLLVRQTLRERSHWNLPGGSLEVGETLAACLVREMREETGLVVVPADLLYVCDRFKELGDQVLDVSFLVRRTSALSFARARLGDERLSEVRMVPIRELAHYGFSERFARLVREGFPERGSYQGDFHAFYGVGSACCPHESMRAKAQG